MSHSEHGRVKESSSGSFSSNTAAVMFISDYRARRQHDELSLHESTRLHVPSVVFRPPVVVWKHLIQTGVNTSETDFLGVMKRPAFALCSACAFYREVIHIRPYTSGHAVCEDLKF